MEKFIPTYLELTEIINSNPNDAEAYYNRGLLIYTFECDFKNSPFQDENETEDEWDNISEDAALKDFEKAIESNKDDDRSYYYNRGQAYVEINEKQKAVNDFRKTIAIEETEEEEENPIFDYKAEAEKWIKKLL